MAKFSFGRGLLSNLIAHKTMFSFAFFATVLGLILSSGIFVSNLAFASTPGNTHVEMEVATAIAMKITSQGDTDPNCTAESGVTYGEVNRYANSAGDDSNKVVDSFNGNEGEKDEVNNNTSCATLSMFSNTYDSTYSDITVYTDSFSGYSLTVRSADNTSPNLVNTENDAIYIPAGVLEEQDGVVPGGQNKWAIKASAGIMDTWTAVTSTDQTIRAYDQPTNNGSATRVTYGISTGNNPTGKYTTTLTYTATIFDTTTNPDIPSANIVLGSSSTSSSTDPTAQITLPEDAPVPYNETRTIPFVVNPGYYIDSITCEGSYDCANYETGETATGQQTIDITNNSKDNSGSVNITTKPIEYPVTVGGDSNNAADTLLSISDTDLTFNYGQSKTIYVTTHEGYELDVDCPEGYTCEIRDATPSDMGEDGSMQKLSAAAHASDATGTEYTLTDSRDENEYTAAKLADGNIWMTQNLNLYNKTLTPEDSDVSSNFTIPDSSTDNWCTENSAACDNQSMALYSDDASYGTYYNWYTATAGTGTYEMTSGNATSSICPKGWRLPTSTEFSTMYNQYGSGANLQATGAGQPAFVHSGTRNGGSTNSQGSYGYYWSSTALNSNFAYLLYLASSNVYPQYSNLKYYGFSVRCVADNSAPLPTVITITNNDTTAGGSVSLKTKKQEYEVAITPSLNATTDTNSLKIPYGESKTFTITPVTGYYLTGLTCSDGYTCSTPTYGSAADPNATSRGAQTITVTNNNKTGTGAVQPILSNLYRISFSKTNISSPSASYVDVAYGGQTTVTVTPASGYYLSAFSGCPSGWTCSGVSTGTSYTGNQTLTLKNNSSTNTGTITLAGTIAAEYMQNFSCSTLSTGVTKQLRDSRDNQDYNVAKLKDGKCWMTQNLRLKGYTLKPADSNVASNWNLPSAADGMSYNAAYVFDTGNTDYGVYYSWYAATAGQGTSSKSSGDVSASVCPKGWRLPTSTEFNTMYNQYGSSASLRATGAGQPAFVLSGNRDGSSTYEQGSGGYYWSSTAYDRNYAYYSCVYSSGVNPQNYYVKYDGFSVRCVAS